MLWDLHLIVVGVSCPAPGGCMEFDCRTWKSRPLKTNTWTIIELSVQMSKGRSLERSRVWTLPSCIEWLLVMCDLRHSRRGRASRCGRSDGGDWDGVWACWVSQSHMKKVMRLMHDMLLLMFLHICPYVLPPGCFSFLFCKGVRIMKWNKAFTSIWQSQSAVFQAFGLVSRVFGLLGWSTLYPACLSGNIASLIGVFKTYSINLCCFHFHGQLLKSMT